MTPRQQEYEDRKKRIIELLLKGITSRVVIAERIGCSQDFVSRAISAHMKGNHDEKAQRVAG